MNQDAINQVLKLVDFTLFNQMYDRFLALFPTSLHWMVSLIVLVAIGAAFFNLVRYHWIFLVVLIFLLPFIFPMLSSFFSGVYALCYHLLAIIWTGAPKPN